MYRRAPGRLLFAALIGALLIPLRSGAAVDPSCLTTAGVSGTVKDITEAPVSGVTVELYQPNSVVAVGSATTSTSGAYHVCSSRQHDTWDVHVKDIRQPPTGYPKYADVSRPYTSWANQGSHDFTPASGFPLLYKLSLSVTPSARKSVTAPIFDFVVLTKMPFPSGGLETMQLSYRKSDDFNGALIPILLSQAGTTVPGGPDAGGWNRWTGTLTLEAGYADRSFYAFAQGVDATTGDIWTEMGRQPFFVDNKLPIFGTSPSPVNGTPCGSPTNTSVLGFEPYYQTTNLKPTIIHGVCDDSYYGSGLDPLSAVTKVCPDAIENSSCSVVTPTLTPTQLYYTFPSALPYGSTRYILWSIADRAGNVASQAWDVLRVVSSCEAPAACNKPDITAPGPGNLGSGQTFGVVQGCKACNPSSVPQISFKIVDRDGPEDVNQGAVHVRIYYQTEQAGPIYDFDPQKDPTYDPTKPDPNRPPGDVSGGGTIQLNPDQSLSFYATGFSLAGKPSGRYIVSASAMDFGGNASELTWHFILVAAA